MKMTDMPALKEQLAGVTDIPPAPECGDKVEFNGMVWRCMHRNLGKMRFTFTPVGPAVSDGEG